MTEQKPHDYAPPVKKCTIAFTAFDYSFDRAQPSASYTNANDRRRGQPRVTLLEYEDELTLPSPVPFLGIPIAPGLTTVLGTAGTGKTTTLGQIASALASAGRAVFHVHVNEPDYVDDVGCDEWEPALAAAIDRALRVPRGCIIVDSIRHFTTIGTGYESRLGSSGFDLTTLQALSDLDRLGRRLAVPVIVALFLSTYQVTKGDLGNDEMQRKILNTLAADVDGCATSTILMGPLRREAGQYRATSRLDRSKTWSGSVPLAVTSSAGTTHLGWRSINGIPKFIASRAAGRAEAVVYAEQLLKTARTSLRRPKSERFNDAPDAIPSDPTALIDRIEENDLEAERLRARRGLVQPQPTTLDREFVERTLPPIS